MASRVWCSRCSCAPSPKTSASAWSSPNPDQMAPGASLPPLYLALVHPVHSLGASLTIRLCRVLTARKLGEAGIPVTLTTDNAVRAPTSQLPHTHRFFAKANPLTLCACAVCAVGCVYDGVVLKRWRTLCTRWIWCSWALRRWSKTEASCLGYPPAGSLPRPPAKETSAVRQPPHSYCTHILFLPHTHTHTL